MGVQADGACLPCFCDVGIVMHSSCHYDIDFYHYDIKNFILMYSSKIKNLFFYDFSINFIIMI